MGDVCEPLPAVSFEEVETGTSSNSNTVTTSAALTAVDDALYLAAVSYRSNLGVASVSGLGLTWTLRDEQCSGQDSTGVSLWSAQGSPSGDGTVTATLTGSASRAVIAVTRYSDVSPSDPFGTVISGNAHGIEGVCTGGVNSNAYSFDLSTSVDNALAYGAVARRHRNHTPGAGYSERADEQSGPGGQAAGVAVEDRSVPTPTTLPIDGSLNASADWAFVGLELKPVLPECIEDPDCDDGLHCNGVEICELGSCQAGTSVVCDDAVGCTDEVCNELTDSCEITPDDANCGDGDACTTDVCDPVLDCQNEPIEPCEIPLPATSDWGMTALGLLLLALGGLLLHRPGGRA